MIKAIIFDLDGVLVDALEWHYEALNQALALFGHGINREDHTSLYNGLPTKLKLEIYSQRTELPKSLHPFIHEMKQLYTQELIEKHCKPNQKQIKVLRSLKSRGYKLAVATNSVRASLDNILSKLEIDTFFEVTFSNEDVAHPKPEPDIYLSVLRALGINPLEALVIEDSVPGIQAARKAGTKLLVVRSPNEVTAERLEPALSSRPTTTQKGEPKPAILEIVIPMAGMGTRFLEAGYTEPKPFIPVFDKPMIQWVIENVRPKTMPCRFHFICSEGQLTAGLFDRLKQWAPGSSVTVVPDTTQGAACTVMLARGVVDPNHPLLLANSDQWVNHDIDRFIDDAIENQADGSILTFRDSNPKWSFAKTDERGRVVEVAEKKPISDQATVGIYYFSKAQHFFSAAQNMIRNDKRTRGEFYVCPVYNELIADGKTIRSFEIPASSMHGLGTPQDLKDFLDWGRHNLS